MNRAEHLAWCKQRAHEYVALGDLGGAMASMISDLGKHEETARSVDIAPLFMAEVMTGDSRRVASFIDGFN